MFIRASLATEVRKNWSRFLDAVVREKPQVVQRNRDLAFVIALPHLEEILKNYRFTLECEWEEDGSCTGTVKEIGLVGNAKSIDELKMELAKELLEYALNYMNEFALYFNSPNRKDHFPYVMHVLVKNSVEEVVDLIDGGLE